MNINLRLVGLLVWGFLWFAPLHAQESSLIQPFSIPVQEGNDSIRFGVVLPPSYAETDHPYPVIYYMHGANRYYVGPRAQWIASYFNEKFTGGLLPEFILVFIDGGEGYWMNHYDGDPQLETAIVNDLIPFMDSNYRTDRARRVTMGYSLGGNGAIFFFTKHPELFAAGVSLDGGIVTYEDYLVRTGGRPEIISDEDYFNEFGSPYGWVNRNREALIAKQDTCIFLSAALLKEANSEFASLLRIEGISFKYIELKYLDHEFGYVFSGSEEALMQFLSEKFR